MRAFRKRKNQIILLIVIAACVIGAVSMALVYGSLAGKLESQRAAERFQGESGTRFAQVTAFFPVNAGIDRNQVFNFQQSLETGLTGASLEAPEGGSLYMDAWSAKGTVSVTGERGTASVEVLGVGGEFFRFHPLYLRSGSYISSDDLMQDRVILDEELAWQLFGGVDLAGMQVMIGDKPYQVAGVVSRETDWATRRAYTGGPGMFMSYEALSAMSEIPISCYELVCADPVSGFALSQVTEAFSEAVTLENSSRFSVESIFGVIGDFGERSMREAAVAFPYWENAARLQEDYLAVVLLAALLFAILPSVTAVIAAILLVRAGCKKLRRKVPELIERRQEERYRRREADNDVR